MRACVLLLLLSCASMLHAQDGAPCLVTAKSGINIRSTPALNGSKLISVPFGSYLEVLEDRFYHYQNPEIAPSVVKIDGLDGRWLKVRYQGVTGYAFDAYFGEAELSEKGGSPYALLLEYAGCNTLIFPKDAFAHHYGLYRTASGEFELAEAGLEYNFDLPNECTASAELQLRTQRKPASEFILASDAELPLGEVPTYYDAEKSPHHYIQTGGEDGDRVQLGSGKGELRGEFVDGVLQSVYFSDRGIVQYLDLCIDDTPCHPENDPEALNAGFSLRWAGDLDGDSHPDLLLLVGFSEFYLYDLWLSSAAAKGDLLGRVARHTMWQCC